ncbi:MAG: hypothetical protein NE328_12475 [Lentisphaeraceae bacterium]|nr:hypothetical protein [Lentisphaeraceae bacterium]
MTYCVALRLEHGIVGIADTCITSGSESTNAKKLYTFEKDNNSLFLMTSGLRSVRDKALTYFTETIEDRYTEFDKLYKAVNAFSTEIKKVASEDKKSLHESGLSFNMHTIVGGQMSGDNEPKVYLIYPEGNWIEIGDATPFMIIGNSGFGKPILSRSVNYHSSIEFALKTAILSFDSTRVCANDVGFPIDCFIYKKDSHKIVQQRYEEKDIKALSEAWAASLRTSIQSMSTEWMNGLLENAGVKK